ncbi:hypothetical protein [Demequina lignilytica]|uniref:Tetratricopeptide repeat-containing protein n=1 Tax=Demequina lignilytica TaxID=3051663 RepID=A0AAW7M461_9MICO|nr:MULTISPECIES: hypothetical protein [unclassified Demequina]MDN4477164.1 hypothetical protein [Demequina sp. SYSU T00039-1]MDN4484012.1 hypothetical protein [Demequina sp. SYSU T0a273]MDN4487337.1 hypothetical protein [Demequina sp. SYSU T00039]MDN4491090.1 hypothetical protein [Demequina sp. SYSU T00068]
MKLLRRPAFLAAGALTLLLALYISVVASLSFALLRDDSWLARGIGVASLVLPFVAAWYLWQEWRLVIAVQRMGARLEQEGRLPVHDGPRTPSGRLEEQAARDVYEVARAGVDLEPDSWVAWFHLAAGYSVMEDRAQARRSYRYAAELFRRSAG